MFIREGHGNERGVKEQTDQSVVHRGRTCKEVRSKGELMFGQGNTGCVGIMGVSTADFWQLKHNSSQNSAWQYLEHLSIAKKNWILLQIIAMEISP